MKRLDQRLVEALTNTPPITGNVAFLCAKGGVSKTVQTAVVGSILSEYLDIDVAAVDFNPDQGTLGIRTAPHHIRSRARTIRELIDQITYTHRASNLDDFVTPTAHGLSVIASGNARIDAQDIAATQYQAVMDVLHERFPLVLIDTGNSMTTEVYQSVLATVDQIVLVSSFIIDAAVTADNTLARIRQGGGRLARVADRALVSFMQPSKISDSVDVAHIRQHFAAKTDSGIVREIPWDEHINEGGVIDVERLSPEARRQFMILAADVAASMSGQPLFSTTVLPEFL